VSNLRQSNGDDYPDAAAKNIIDAEALLSKHRYDGAGYLAGYVVECVLKTISQIENGKTVRRHHLNDLSQSALHLASLSTAKTAKYIHRPQITTMSYGLPNGWQETLRYHPEGKITNTTATDWVNEARRLHNEIIKPMKLDGVITP